MTRSTPLLNCHKLAGARLVEFGGWEMPLHYGSQVDEHHAVRRGAGMFDVSHMTIVDVEGAGSGDFLANLLANNIARLTQDGMGLYSCMLNNEGGVIDDLIVYRTGESRFRLVVNAATREQDLDWINQRAAKFPVSIAERSDLAMIAIQGPQARALAAPLLPDSAGEAALALKPFTALHHGDWFIARTGYTGEDGWEVVMPKADAPEFWNQLLVAGVRPCGLGARDTLRLESGLNLYGQDMTLTTSPLESNLAWTVAWEPEDRHFVGRDALRAQKDKGVTRRLVGLLLEGRGVMRAGYSVHTDKGAGIVTSGGFSPTMERSIALARVPVDASSTCEVEIRNRRLGARIVRPPFVKLGEIKIDSGED